MRICKMKNEKISKDDKAAQKFMRAALAEARKAFDADEVPVNCVMVRDGKILARAHNKKEAEGDATAHAEILCIQKACKRREFPFERLRYVCYRALPYVRGAIINARIGRVFSGRSMRRRAAAARFTIFRPTNDLTITPLLRAVCLRANAGRF